MEVFRAAMPQDIVAANVLGQPRAALFVDRSIEAGALGGDDRYWVAEGTTGDVIGFAQLRLGLRVAFINNIHVLPRYQGRGIGTRLMQLMAAVIEAPEVVADVFLGSTVSAEIFMRAGLKPTETYHWHLLDPAAGDPGPYVVYDLPQADVVHAAFDLSTIRVETSDRIHPVGRMGARLFRVTASAALEDPALRSALTAIDPQRSVLAIVERSTDPLPTSPTLVSRRLAGSLEDLVGRYAS